MIESIPAPATPLASIQNRIALRRKSAGAELARPRRRLAAVAAVALLAFPTVAYSIVSYEARSRAALQARGGWAPPPPAGFVAKLIPRTVTFLQAKSEAGFAMTAPAGLPKGASLMRIEMEPIGRYEPGAHTWRIGPVVAIFRYRRADGRSFDVTLWRYDERDLPGRYTFEDRGPDAHGNPVLVKHENFSWRNGDQMTVTTENNAIDKEEILSMARSMNGTLLTLRWPRSRDEGTFRLMGY